MLNEPLVSIVLTSYNQPDLLQKAFDSLINQTYKNIEIVIVDDCSTDTGNKKLIKEFEALYPQKVSAFHQKKNVGIPINKNTGFRLAKGEYITYLDGDDTYYENKIMSELETFFKHPDVDVVYSNFDIKTLNGKLLRIWADKTPAQGYIFKDIILNNFPDCHTHRCELFKKHVLYDLNFYNEKYSIYHDLDFMLQYSLKYKVAYNDYVASSYYKNPESIVQKNQGLKLIEQKQEVYEKYLPAIQDRGIKKKFKRFLNNLKLDKLFYCETINSRQLFQAFLMQPYQIVKIAKIINYLHKTKNV